MSKSLKPATPEAYQLLLEGVQTFAKMSAIGIRIDEAYLRQSIESTKNRITEMQQLLETSEEYKVWRRVYGDRTNLNSRVQLGEVLFRHVGKHKRNPFMVEKDRTTGNSRPMNSEAAFEHVKTPFREAYFGIAKLKKALTTNLLGIQKETINGRLHPFFDLHTVESYRSSSSRPNFHNQPTRDKVIAEIVRKCIIPRKGNVLLEADYSTQEVKVSWCYNKDPILRRDILEGDMHTDRAKDLFMLTDKGLGSIKRGSPGYMTRYIAKNRFVFAEFYGDYYANIAPKLWDAISLYGLTDANGKSLFEHLSERGIYTLGACDPAQEAEEGTYEMHVRDVERRMWNETYQVYNQWKQDWWAQYQRQGGIHTLTGFTLSGVFRKNQILCDPIQGSAFHCLLWSLIQIQKEFVRKKMKARIINQIHDSMVIDCPEREIQDVVEIVLRYAVRKVAKHWNWIQIPLSVDFELCRSNWYDKAALELAV